jgi:hypothetical protein
VIGARRVPVAVRVLVLAVLAAVIALALLSLQHRTVTGDVHVVTALDAVSCVADDAAPTIPDVLPIADPMLAGLLLLALAAVLLVVVVITAVERPTALPRPPGRTPLPVPFFDLTPGLLRV